VYSIVQKLYRPAMPLQFLGISIVLISVRVLRTLYVFWILLLCWYQLGISQKLPSFFLSFFLDFICCVFLNSICVFLNSIWACSRLVHKLTNLWIQCLVLVWLSSSMNPSYMLRLVLIVVFWVFIFFISSALINESQLYAQVMCIFFISETCFFLF
jgi:hypothetical protein